jgi:hypothetical protein
MKISTGKVVFEGENIIAYGEDLYIVFSEDGQGQIVIPSIEKYELEHGIRQHHQLPDGTYKVDLFCPNMRVLNHEKNQWSREDEHTIVCSECGCKMNIKNIEGRAKLEEAK